MIVVIANVAFEGISIASIPKQDARVFRQRHGVPGHLIIIRAVKHQIAAVQAKVIVADNISATSFNQDTSTVISRPRTHKSIEVLHD